MKYLSEFRDPKLARLLIEKIHRNAHVHRQYRLMEFCGGHTHAIFRYGIPSLLPTNVEYVHGPGCPVCVLPASRIDKIIRLAQQQEFILCTYADLMRVPVGKMSHSLQSIKAAGVDVRMIYSPMDALTIAENTPEKQVVFFAIGFETTAPATAATLLEADRRGINNFSIYCNHVLTPAALRSILDGQHTVDGILGPSHVSTIVGSDVYEGISQQYRMPIVIAGFEPLDVLQSTLMLIDQINNNSYAVENEYGRAVSRKGNVKAQQLLERVFETRERFDWRGLGTLENSAMRIRPSFKKFDLESRLTLPETTVKENPACECPAVLRGAKRPTDCRLFGNPCRPESPLGACMVSSEGACAAQWLFQQDHLGTNIPESIA